MAKFVNFIDTDNLGSEECKRIAFSYCKNMRNKGCTDWTGIVGNYIERQTEKAYYVETIVPDSEMGKGCVSIKFWIPRKFLHKHEGSYEVPLWFLEKKVEECFQ